MLATPVPQSLPLRPAEIKAAGLPESTPDKLPLFIERLIVKKQAADKPEDVRVWMRVVNFILRE